MPPAIYCLTLIIYDTQKSCEMQVLVSVNKTLWNAAKLNLHALLITLQHQSEIVAMETLWPTNPEIFIIWPFKE